MQTNQEILDISLFIILLCFQLWNSDDDDDDDSVYLHITVYYNNHEKSEFWFWINWLVKSRFSQQRPVFKGFFNAAAEIYYCNTKSKDVFGGCFSEHGKYTLYTTLVKKKL